MSDLETAEISKSTLNDLSSAETELLLTQFFLFIQQKSMGICHLYTSDDPQELSADEMIALKDEFKAKLQSTAREVVEG